MHRIGPFILTETAHARLWYYIFRGGGQIGPRPHWLVRPCSRGIGEKRFFRKAITCSFLLVLFHFFINLCGLIPHRPRLILEVQEYDLQGVLFSFVIVVVNSKVESNFHTCRGAATLKGVTVGTAHV
jgi:hypothetical protein